ncbi:MAG: thymidine phosphorylase [Planctomycetota bacterium]|nr:thymidine phosphorylase [Planctomycetota bacterium]
MSMLEAIRAKALGEELSAQQSKDFISAYLAGDLGDEQATELLAAIFEHGMGTGELVAWTEAMLNSGERLSWPGLEGPILDKHSTGGVGDKASLPLAPALAACGAKVPMISGRGLGHTGGTLDKLEAIPGLSTSLSVSRLREIMEQVGVVIAAQTETLVPADRRLYALRDATGYVASIPLIASSILSKKLAEGLDALVLDVKFGTGATMVDPADGEELAHTMLALAGGCGLSTTVFQTAMDQPLGRAVGHTLEVDEALECMRGEGPADLRELVVALGGALLSAGRLCDDEEAGRVAIGAALDNGSARDCFAAMIEAQGGEAGVIENPGLLPRTGRSSVWCSPASGVLDLADCRELGLAVADLGGARSAGSPEIDPAVGLRWLRRVGDEVQAGDALVEVLYRDGSGLAAAEARLGRVVRFDTGRTPGPLILGRLDS